MKQVFVDTHYWLAVVRPDDQHKEAARRARSFLGNVILVTTDEVLTEFLAALSSHGEMLRCHAARVVRKILADPNVRVMPQTRDSFLDGVELYEKRPDKKYSLTDCISMNTMWSQSIGEILTKDHHFTQEGFTVFMK